jgi:thymidine kinase
VKGTLEAITGNMFSGKTEDLIKRLNLALIARKKVSAYKHKHDTRYSESTLASHGGQTLSCKLVCNSQSILDDLYKTNRIPDVIGIDEGNFFDDKLPEVVDILVNKHMCRVIVSGLNQNYKGEPFGPMPAIMAMADDVQLLFAVCSICGAKATKSQRIVEDSAEILPGGKESYEPRCRDHHTTVMWPKQGCLFNKEKK